MREQMDDISNAALAPPRLSQSTLEKQIRALQRFITTKRLGSFGLFIVLATAIMAIGAPIFSTTDPWDVNRRAILLAPDASHWFGTDRLGRDLFSRVAYGSRISIYVGVVSMLSAGAIGSLIGVTSAYFGGYFDLIVQRFIDATAAFPTLLLALALMAAFGSSLNNILLSLTIVFTPRVARVVRSVSLSIKEMPYVESARAIGASDLRIMLRHLLPNTFASLIVVATSLIGSAVLIEASLSFLGVGLPADVISWGAMLAGDILIDFASAPWVGIFPAMALTIAVFGVNIFGDALRDVLDPRLRGTQ